MAYRFEEFLYDPADRALFRGGREVALTPKGRDLLTLFLHNPRRLLTRREISGRLWPDVAVTDDSLRFQVAELRKALGESGRFSAPAPRACSSKRTRKAGGTSPPIARGCSYSSLTAKRLRSL
ncbi:MAG: transcriptional regulator [Thermoanaerobaculia bacterium]